MSSLLSDQRLAQRAAGGEERAFAAIFDRYHQPLYRYCMAIVGDSQDAQDALQNTMLKVLRALPGEQREIKLKPWLYRIAHNESIEVLRRRRDTRELGSELVAPGPSLSDDLSSRERLRQLLSDVDELPERQRGALVMRELAGLDFDGIATALGTSAAVARQTLYEARLSLHQMDEGRGMDCTTVTQALSDGDGRVIRRRDVRAHLRSCPDCRRFQAEIEDRERNFAALAPLPAVAAAGLLQSLLGGGAAGGGGGGAAGAAVAGGAAKTLGSSAALKGAAAVLAIAAIGTGAAERGGLIDLGLPGGGSAKTAPAQRRADLRVAPSAANGGFGASPAAAAIPASQAGPSKSRPAASTLAPEQQNAGERATGAAPVTSADQTAAQASPAAKQLPAAAAHGQQTAAAHKESSPEQTGEEHSSEASHPAHPEHPVHPEHPEHPVHPNNGQEKTPPGQEKVPPGQAKKAAPEANAPEAEPEAITTPDAGAEEAPGQRGKGKKP